MTTAYRGPDRRGIIGRPDRRATYVTATWLVAAVTGLPLLVVGMARATGSVPRVWSAGAGDAAFVGFIVVTVLLALRWRLIGEAACVSFLAGSSLVGLLIVPSTTRLGGGSWGYLDAARATALILALALYVDAARAPDVRSDARPARLVAGVIALSLVPAVPLALSPLRGVLADPGTGLETSGIAEAVACAAVAVVLIRSGARRKRMLRLSFGVSAVSLGVGYAVPALVPLGSADPWVVLPEASLLMSALVVLAVLVWDVKVIIGTVVLQDLRGRRRWEAAETELTEVRNGYQGQRHDVKSVLSAVDGTLLVLSRHRGQLSGEHVDRLITALREQVRFLQEMFAGTGGSRSYDLSELLGAIVSVRSSGGRSVRGRIQPGLEVHGHPDRVAVIVHDLLANAATHAPGADVTVRAARVLDDSGVEAVEIDVSDDGPGIPERDMSRAMERGWRGSTGRTGPGSGLGLYQCRQIAEAEGGSLVLETTDAQAPEGRHGLTARLRIPLYRTDGTGRPGPGTRTGSPAEIFNSVEAPPPS